MPASRAQRLVPAVGVTLALGALLVIRVHADPNPSAPPAPPAPPTTTEPARVATRNQALLAGIHFTDVTAASGLRFTPSRRTGSDTPSAGMVSGASVADIDQDGRPDVLLTGLGRASALFHNDGHGRFRDVTITAGLPSAAPEGATAATFADIDADGDQDLLLLGFGTAPDALYRNDGAGHFTADRTSGIDLVTGGKASARLGATFADVNGDGSLDLLETNWDQYALAGPPGRAADDRADDGADICARTRATQAHPGARSPGLPANRTRLYLNDGHGHFHDGGKEMGLDLSQALAFTPLFADLDGDGWPDLLLTGDTCTSRVLHNDHGRRFIDITATIGAGSDENGMGSVVRDLNGDGRPDWFVTSISYPTADGSCPATYPTGCSGNRLFLSRPDGTFEDATTAWGLRDGGWGWGAAIEDFGNDGRLAVTMTNGYPQPASAPASGPQERAFFGRFVDDPMRFWVPTGQGPAYVDAAADAGLTDTGVGHGLVAFDYDGDGRLDLLVADSASAPHLYRNTSPAQRTWLTVRLDDPSHPGNRQAIGAEVTITSDGRSRPVTQWITTAGSYMAQKLPEAHVGFGDERSPDVTVTVRWPDSDQPQVVRDVPTDRIVTITRS